MKVNELRVLAADELDGRLRAARRELYELRFKHAVGQLVNSSEIAKVRHDIARIMTVLSERELGIAPIVVAEAEPATETAAAAVDSGFEDDAAESTQAAEPEAAPEPEVVVEPAAKRGRTGRTDKKS